MHQDNISVDALAWDAELAKLVELETQPYTHYCKAEGFESRIDRVWWSLPPWMTRLMSITRVNYQPAHSFHSKGLSDHAPNGFILAPSSPLPLHNQPIPSFVSRHPIYKSMLADYETRNNITAHKLIQNSTNENPFEAMHCYKGILRKVAAQARNVILAQYDLPESRD
eukprot:11224261-Karenia_brevis.AAC.1